MYFNSLKHSDACKPSKNMCAKISKTLKQFVTALVQFLGFYITQTREKIFLFTQNTGFETRKM